MGWNQWVTTSILSKAAGSSSGRGGFTSAIFKSRVRNNLLKMLASVYSTLYTRIQVPSADAHLSFSCGIVQLYSAICWEAQAQAPQFSLQPFCCPRQGGGPERLLPGSWLPCPQQAKQAPKIPGLGPQPGHLLWFLHLHWWHRHDFWSSLLICVLHFLTHVENSLLAWIWAPWAFDLPHCTLTPLYAGIFRNCLCQNSRGWLLNSVTLTKEYAITKSRQYHSNKKGHKASKT